MPRSGQTTARLGTLFAVTTIALLSAVGCGRELDAGSASPEGPLTEGDSIGPVTSEPTTSPAPNAAPQEEATGLPTRVPELELSDFDMGSPVAGADGVFSADPGQCLAEPSPGARVSCDGQHGAEVFYTFNLQGGDYPGDGQVRDEAAAQCGAQVVAYLGGEDTESRYTVTALTPSRATWEDDGDTEVLCLLTSDGPTSGSAFQSER